MTTPPESGPAAPAMPWPPPWQEYEQLTLDFKRFACRQVIPASVTANARLSVRQAVDMCVDGMVVELVSHVLGQKLPPHTETRTVSTAVQCPASWWQHLKHQHCGRWWMRPLIRRRPPRMTTVRDTHTLTATWEHMAAYPWSDYVIPPPHMGDAVHLRFLSTQLDSRRDEPG